jgi:iron complex transport system substrate-binding protein
MVIVSVSACSSSDPVEAGDSGSPAGVWSFTDDRDITHTLPEVPDVIAAQSVPAGGLWEYGIEIDGVFGPLRRPDGSPDPAIGLADPADFTSLGEIDSEINLEALAALQPDIIVTSMWDDGTYWGIDDEEADQLVSWASVHAYGYGNLAAIIDRLAEAVATASPDLV